MAEVARVLRSGGLVISPTDTVYGILGDAADESAISKMFALKNRPAQKAFPVFVQDIAMARRYAYISDAKARFLEKVWPGPVTVVFRHKEKLPKVLTDGLDTIGMRIPCDPFLIEVLKRVDAPVAQTSANISNEPPAETVEQIKEYFEKSKTPPVQPDHPGGPELVIDGGQLIGRPSTVIDFARDNPVILRAGTVTKEELDGLFRTVIE